MCAMKIFTLNLSGEELFLLRRVVGDWVFYQTDDPKLDKVRELEKLIEAINPLPYLASVDDTKDSGKPSHPGRLIG